MNLPLNDLTVMFLLWVLLLHPATAWHGYRKLARGEPIGPKLYRFRLSFYVILLSTLMALAVAVTNQLPLPWAASTSSLFLGLTFSAIYLVSATSKRRQVDPAQEERIRLLYAPTNTKEWIWAVWVGLCAGVGEEIVYRGVLFQIISLLTSSASVALLVCVLAFALAHLPQGTRATYGIALLGICFHILYFVSGGLAAPIVAHAVYDVAILTVFYRREISNSRSMMLKTVNGATLTTPE